MCLVQNQHFKAANETCETSKKGITEMKMTKCWIAELKEMVREKKNKY